MDVPYVGRHILSSEVGLTTLLRNHVPKKGIKWAQKEPLVLLLALKELIFGRKYSANGHICLVSTLATYCTLMPNIMIYVNCTM